MLELEGNLIDCFDLSSSKLMPVRFKRNLLFKNAQGRQKMPKIKASGIAKGGAQPSVIRAGQEENVETDGRGRQ